MTESTDSTDSTGTDSPPTTQESTLAQHARSELSRFETDTDYIDGICKVMDAFAAMGHSGGSASIAIPQINALLQWENLTDLTDDPAEWNQVETDLDNANLYQNTRNSKAFSTDGGKTYTLLWESQLVHTSAKSATTS